MSAATRLMTFRGLAARKAPRLAEFADASRVLIAACHPRAVKWLFAAGGAPLHDERVTEIQAGSYALMDTHYERLGLPFVSGLRHGRRA